VRNRTFFSLLFLAFAAWGLVLLAGPAEGQGRAVTEDVSAEVLEEAFGGTVQAASATTGQVLAKQSDGSWQGAADTGGETLDATLTLGSTSTQLMTVGSLSVTGTTALGGDTTITGSLTPNVVLDSAGAAGTTDQYLAVTSGGTMAWATAGGAGPRAVDIRALATSLVAPVSSTSTPTLDTRGAGPAPIHLMDFDDTTKEAAYLRVAVPLTYTAAGDLTLDITWSATSAVTGDVTWAIRPYAITPGTDDIDADGWGTETRVTDTTDGTSGAMTTTTVTLSGGATLDSVLAGEVLILEIARDPASGGSFTDDMVGDAEILLVHLYSSS